MQHNILNISKVSKSLGALCISIAMTFSMLTYAQTYTVNFKDADVQELIKFVADSTGRTIVVDPKVKGKIRVVSSKPVSESELYDLFLSVLEINGFAAVDAGGIIRVVPARDARTQPVPVYSGSERKTGRSGYVTQVIQVENVEASKLIPVLRPLVPSEAHLAAYSDSNVIVITDTSDNIERIRRVIQRLDSASSEDTEVIRLHNASAEEAVKTLETLQKAQLTGGKKSSSGSSLQNQAQLVADARTNSILVTGPKVARDRIRVLATRIDRPGEYSGGAKVIRLKHATAKDLVTVLTKVAEANNSKDSRKTVIQADESTNAVIISGSADMVQTLAGVIDQLDVQRSQVLIEAIIVEIQDGDSKNLGIDWLFADSEKGFGTSGGTTHANILGAYGSADSSDTSTVASTFASLGAAIGGIADPAFGLAKINTAGMSFITLLKALQNNTESNILSTPSILTLDNHEAEIVVGQEVPFVTGSYSATTGSTTSPFQTITRENVGISLKVTPHIGQDGNITMDIEQEVSTVSNSTQASDVITNERSIQTSVSTQDGQIVVLGGLVEDQVTESQTKVPLLGDIPLLGRLFKSNETGLTKKHLMVFIRPTIVNSRDRLERVSQDRYENIRHSQVHKRERGVALYDSDVSPVLPSYTEQVRNENQLKTRVESPHVVKEKKKDSALVDFLNGKRRTKTKKATNTQPVYQEVYTPPQTNINYPTNDVDQLRYERAPVYSAPVQTAPVERNTNSNGLRFTPPPEFSPVTSTRPRTSKPTYVAPKQPVVTPRYEAPVSQNNNSDYYDVNADDIEPIVTPRGNSSSDQQNLDSLYRELDY